MAIPENVARLERAGEERQMKKAETLKENWEFRRLYQRGESAVAPAMVVYCKRNREGRNRLGITVSTKLGCAVVRNRIKRRLREVYRLSAPRLRQGYDFVIVGRSRALDLPFDRLLDSFHRLCRKLEVWEEKK